MSDDAPLIIGIGGNIGDDAAICQRFASARAALAELGAVRSAPLYRTAPVGPEQRDFLNTAVRLRIADAQPTELIATLLELERLLGRDRFAETRWGPRTIDLDVLVWGQRVLSSPDLIVPHPRLVERRFALEPLVALLGEWFDVPGAGEAGALLARVRDQNVVEIAASW